MSEGERDVSAGARRHMVERLLQLGCNRRVVAAMGRLERERFVPHFWSQRPSFMSDHRQEAIEYTIGDPPDPETLDLLYDIDRAHGVHRAGVNGERVISTASAPTVLAAQSEMLWLHSGMSVLEIGTGIGYFAALLAELVGPDGRVISVELDADVAALARERLGQAGYPAVQVITGDGHEGAAEQAPFDRIVCSVGCTDVSGAWLDQLTPGGFALVPLLHGVVHPMLRVDGQGWGEVVMRSGYIRIQGAQENPELWPHARGELDFEDSEVLPGWLVDAVKVEPGTEGIRRRREWDLDFWVAIHDQRTGRTLLSLADGDGSCAAIRVDDNLIRWGGASGPDLGDQLLAYVDQWRAAGAPRLEDYSHRFIGRSEPQPHPAANRWVLPRLDHYQVIELASLDVI